MRMKRTNETKRTARKIAMPDAYIVQVAGQTAGIVVRERNEGAFSFFASLHAFDILEGRQFAEPLAAERAVRRLIAARDFVGAVIAERQVG